MDRFQNLDRDLVENLKGCCLSEYEPGDDGIQLCGDCSDDMKALGLTFEELHALALMSQPAEGN